MNPNDWRSDLFNADSHVPHDFGFHLVSQFGSLLENSAYHADNLYVPGNIALQEAFSCVSKFAGALFLWLSTGSIFKSPGCSKAGSSLSGTQVKHVTSYRKSLVGLKFGHGPKSKSSSQLILTQVAASTIKRLWKEVGQLQSFTMPSLSAVLTPPLDNLSSKMLAMQLENSSEPFTKYMDHSPCEDACQSISLSKISWKPDTVEPKTGISFPTVLFDPSSGGDFHHITEVLVGTGSRIMRIVKMKSIKLYAFGLYVHPDSVCEKLGPKYASVPINELKDRSDFFEDLLREDIHMTLRLVVGCNGIKISSVKEAFEKSLRARLEKMNPDPDYHCLSAFGSYFSRDIPLHVGTTIDFRRTADGQLITEIGGRHIGAVHSKDLCRAFFDMYIGEIPVSPQTKQEMVQNVGGLIRRC